MEVAFGKGLHAYLLLLQLILFLFVCILSLFFSLVGFSFIILLVEIMHFDMCRCDSSALKSFPVGGFFWV